MLILLLVWVGVGSVLVCIVCRGQVSAGLPLAYFLGASLIHVPGAALYVDAQGATVVADGFEQTIIGFVAFALGVLLARGQSLGSRKSAPRLPLTSQRAAALSR